MSEMTEAKPYYSTDEFIAKMNEARRWLNEQRSKKVDRRPATTAPVKTSSELVFYCID